MVKCNCVWIIREESRDFMNSEKLQNLILDAIENKKISQKSCDMIVGKL